MRLLLLLASAAAISKVPKAPTAGRAAAISSKTPQKPTTGRAAAKAQAEQAKPLALSGGGANKQVSYAWAVLHNWLYFLSLGLCIPVLPKVIASTVNDDGAAVITSKSARVAGDVEGVDKLLTFLFVGAGRLFRRGWEKTINRVVSFGVCDHSASASPRHEGRPLLRRRRD